MPGPAGDSYEYQLVQLPGRDGTAATQTQLNTLGLLGWQVVAIDTVHARIILMRKLT